MDYTKNPNYIKALEYMAGTDLSSLENGKHVIDGDKLFVNIVDSQLKTPERHALRCMTSTSTFRCLSPRTRVSG